jgi:FeS assembly SUF system regulator
MLRISRITDYATVVMAYLAQQPNAIQNAKDITAHTHIALPTVCKILKLLAKSNLLISHRGANGGYSLARSPTDISITQIIEAIEGDMGLTTCSHVDGQCNIESNCAIRGNWRNISELVLRMLQQVSLSEMIKPSTEQTISLEAFKQQLARPSASRRVTPG